MLQFWVLRVLIILSGTIVLAIRLPETAAPWKRMMVGCILFSIITIYTTKVIIWILKDFPTPVWDADRYWQDYWKASSPNHRVPPEKVRSHFMKAEWSSDYFLKKRYYLLAIVIGIGVASLVTFHFKLGVF